MVATKEHILPVPDRPVESLIPALDGSLKLSEKQMQFLLHAIRSVDPKAVDAQEEIRKRVLEVQSKAYQAYPYLCIRAFHHVALFMSEHDVFAHLLQVGQRAGQAAAPLLLDIGCCMGTDLRHLVQSGYPATSVIGCDIQQDFLDLGHTLYADGDTCPIPFFVGDIFDITLRPFPQVADDAPPSLKEVRKLNDLHGRVKYIYAGAFFHLFDEGTQEAAARRLATLLDVTEESGPAVVFGRHAAKAEEGVIEDVMGLSRYAHSPASWKRMWERVLGGKIPVRVEAEFREKLPESKESGKTLSRGTEGMWWSVWVG